MKTVPTLCATSTGVGISALGFALVRPVHDFAPLPPPHRSNLDTHSLPPAPPPPTSNSVDPRGSRPLHTLGASSLAPPSDMTSTATCTVQTVDTYATPSSFCSPFGFSAARHSLRSASSQSIAPSRHTTDNARATLKKREGQNMPRGGPPTPAHNSSEALQSHQQSWTKRLSFSSSRDSTHDSSPLSVSPSASGSTTPMISAQASSVTSAPNKLVKRSTSLGRASGSAQRGEASSKLPLPVLKRPATSHRRSATLQEQRSTKMPKAEDAFRRSFHASSPETLNDVQWRSFFEPRIAADQSTSRRRASTSIPNPIKRIYPDRKYRPVLVSASEQIDVASPEVVTKGEKEPEDVITSQSLPRVSRIGDQHLANHLERPATFSGPPPSSRSNVSSTTFDLSSKAFPATIDDIDEEQDNDESQEETMSTSSFSVSDTSSADVHLEKELPPPKPPIVKYRRPGTRHSSSTPTSMGNRPSLPKHEDEPLVNHHDVVTPPQASSTPSIANPLAQIDSTLSPRSPKVASTTSSTAYQHGSTGRSSSASNAFSSPNSSSTLRPSHPSISTGFTSLLAGSDSDFISGDDDTSDSQSDLIFDSVRTRAPKSSPGRRGPPIESIFGDSPPLHSHGKHTMLREFLQQAPPHDQANSLKPRHSTIHEEDYISTPARSGRQQSLTSSPAQQTRKSPMLSSLPSSPPSMPSLSDLRQHANRFPSTDDEDMESSWSFSGDDESEIQQPIKNRFAHLGITSDMLSPFANQGSSSTATTPRRRESRQADLETRSSIFDWSEQQPLEKSPNNRSPPRPKTVHGKKDAETRGSRSVGRRAPSGLHVRSQSVPAQDAEGKRGQSTSNKFGTWGIGSKGATEDWNEDFDFEEPPEEKRLDSGISMFVPEKIRKQQTEVLANISLLRDWGLLIEELKELKIRAAGLDVLNGDNKKTWDEVDAMIELADQESDEQTLAPRYSPPSSPSFDYDAFDEPIPTLSTNPKVLAPTPDMSDFLSDVESGFSDYEEAVASPSRVENGILITPATPRRPRKNSEAVARSVIERLQQKTTNPDSAAPSDKVHFDTATLKRIIPHVQELRDKAKKVIRDAEDLLPSPKSGSIGSNGSRSIRRKQREVQESPSTLRRKNRRSAHAISRTPSDEGCQSPTDELSARLHIMAVN